MKNRDLNNILLKEKVKKISWLLLIIVISILTLMFFYKQRTSQHSLIIDAKILSRKLEPKKFPSNYKCQVKTSSNEILFCDCYFEHTPERLVTINVNHDKRCLVFKGYHTNKKGSYMDTPLK